MRRRWIVSLGAFALLLAACSPSSIAENIIESQEGVGDVEIDEDSGEVSIESEDGSMTIGGGEVPDGFPVDLPGGGDVVAVIDAENSATISVEYDDSFDSIAGFYEDWVESSGLEVGFKSESSNPSFVSWSLVVDETGAYSITVAEEGDTTTVLITVTEP